MVDLKPEHIGSNEGLLCGSIDPTILNGLVCDILKIRVQPSGDEDSGHKDYSLRSQYGRRAFVRSRGVTLISVQCPLISKIWQSAISNIPPSLASYIPTIQFHVCVPHVTVSWVVLFCYSYQPPTFTVSMFTTFHFNNETCLVPALISPLLCLPTVHHQL